ncbi:DUF6241 domain-containing protein [Virgibacillus ainsalahensis]
MKKASILIISSLILLGFAGWGAYSWLEDEEPDKTTATEENKTEAKEKTESEQGTEQEELVSQREEIEGVITEDDLAAYTEAGLNPFGMSKQQDELTDRTYQEYIHGMSHQKIKADKKWGFYEIHPQRITWLLDGLEQANVEHESVYKDILKKWEAGNFTSVDEDHNSIWDLQDGTVGKATGILSAEEEQEYVESQAD